MLTIAQITLNSKKRKYMNNKIYCLVRFTRKSGKIDTTLEETGAKEIRLWAIKNTTKTKDTIIFEKDTGIVTWYYEGTGDFPYIFDKDLGYIDDYCPGLLAVIQRD